GVRPNKATCSEHLVHRRFPAWALQKSLPHIRQRRTFTRGSSSRRNRTLAPARGLAGGPFGFVGFLPTGPPHLLNQSRTPTRTSATIPDKKMPSRAIIPLW